MSTTTDRCPDCSGTGKVVTAVTVVTLGKDPRTVLVTRLCASDGCHLKYIVTKSERELDDEERALWYRK